MRESINLDESVARSIRSCCRTLSRSVGQCFCCLMSDNLDTNRTFSPVAFGSNPTEPSHEREPRMRPVLKLSATQARTFREGQQTLQSPTFYYMYILYRCVQDRALYPIDCFLNTQLTLQQERFVLLLSSE